MAQNGKRLDIKRSPLWKTFEENSDEALAQIRSFCTNPVGWLVMIASGFALIGLFFLISFLLAVRAPELIPTPNANVEAPIQTAEELPEESEAEAAIPMTIKPSLILIMQNLTSWPGGLFWMTSGTEISIPNCARQ